MRRWAKTAVVVGVWAVPVLLSLLLQWLDDVDAHNGLPGSGAGIISAGLLFITYVGWPAFQFRTTLPSKGWNAYPHVLRKLEADISRWGVAQVQPPDSTAGGVVLPAAPDYSSRTSWIAAPFLGFNPSHNTPTPAYAWPDTPVPGGAVSPAADLGSSNADVFFLTPTSKYFQDGSKGWNVDVNDTTVRCCTSMQQDAVYRHRRHHSAPAKVPSASPSPSLPTALPVCLYCSQHSASPCCRRPPLCALTRLPQFR